MTPTGQLYTALVSAVRDAEELRAIEDTPLSRTMTTNQLRRRVKELRRAKRRADEQTIEVRAQRDEAREAAVRDADTLTQARQLANTASDDWSASGEKDAAIAALLNLLTGDDQ